MTDTNPGGAATALRPSSTATLDREQWAGLIGIYQDLHRHPELSGHEARTASVVADDLRRNGFEVSTGVGGHGVVGVLRRGEGPVVGLRAELDALPIAEDTTVPYRSTQIVEHRGRRTPVMHACGHDFHLAAMLGAATALSNADWSGTLLILGQPAEETLGGARAMLEDGLYERFPVPDVLLAQHSAPFRAGTVAHAAGPVLAGSSTMRITVHGRGGHAGAPHLTIDPVVTAAAIVLRLQTIVSRETDPGRAVAVTVGRLHAEGSANIVPDRAELEVTVRGHSDADVQRAAAAVVRIARAEADASDCDRPPTVEVLASSRTTVSDPEAAGAVLAAHRAAFGSARVVDWPSSMATEDFPLLGRAGVDLHGHDSIRSAFWMIGTLSQEQWDAAPGSTPEEKSRAVPGNHSPRFLPDLRLALPTAVRALTSAAATSLSV